MATKLTFDNLLWVELVVIEELLMVDFRKVNSYLIINSD